MLILRDRLWRHPSYPLHLLSQRPPGYFVFLLRRRLAQLCVDPLRLVHQWRELSLPNRFPVFLSPQWQGSVAKSVGDQIEVGHLLDALVDGACTHFFFGRKDRQAIAHTYGQRFPESAQRIVDEASDLLHGKFHYAGKAIAGENPPRWYEIQPRNDNAWWHLIPAAFHWLKTLGKAYWLTGDKRHAECARQWIASWLDTPPDFRSDFWTSTCFVGTRALNILAGLVLFADAWCSDIELVRRLIGVVGIHAELVAKRMEYWGANHLIWNAHDLALLGLATEPVFERAPAWQSQALRVLQREVPRQFYPDGINFELSIGYQVFVTKLIGEVIANFWKAGMALRPEIVWGFERSVEAIEELTRPDGRLPLYGDSYRSEDPNLETGIDQAVPLLVGLRDRLMGTRSPSRLPNSDSPLLPWLLGSRYSWSDVSAAPQVVHRSQALYRCAPQSGVAALKMNDIAQGQTLYACLQAGRSSFGAVHAHADSLSLELADEHGPILVDPGAYVENSGPWRTYFRSSRAHNTVVVNGQDICHVEKVYHLWPGSSGKVLSCYRANRVMVLEAEHGGYLRLPSRVMHRRVIVLWEADCAIIVDVLNGKKPFMAQRFFHFAPGDLQLCDAGWQWQGNERCWSLFSACSSPVAEQVICGSETPPSGWLAEYRGHRVPIPVLVQRAEGAASYRFVSVFAAGQRSIKVWLEHPESSINWDWKVDLLSGCLAGRRVADTLEIYWWG